MLQFVPFAPLVHSANASSDVLTYAQFNLPPDAQADLYPAGLFKNGQHGRIGSLVGCNVVARHSVLYLTATAGRRQYRGALDW